MAHENNVTKFRIDKEGNKVWYNEVGKLKGGKNNPSAHPSNLNKRYMKTFKTKAEAEKEAKSISSSYNKKLPKKSKKS